jgi:thymidine kinase
MACLRFSYGTMGSGKSTVALQIHHNLSATSLGMLCSMHDRGGAEVSSALGVSAPAAEVRPDTDFYEMATHYSARSGLDFMVCDEAQFYDARQVEQLARVVDELDVDVYAFGLLTDFRGRLFPGTARLLELADERQELQVQARCWCGAAATHNARLVGGEQVYHGDVVLIDDGQTAETTYVLRCRRHWLAGESGEQLPASERLRSVG